MTLFKWIYLFLLLVQLILRINADPEYENSTDLCKRCKCTITDIEFDLDCKSQQMKHVLVNWPKHNVTLNAIFSYNNISHLDTLPSSNFVKELVFDHCGIKSIQAGAFENVRFLELLDLSYNLLTSEEIGPETFKGPFTVTTYNPLPLKILNLGHNQIHSLSNNLFEHMSQLQELYLDGNDFHILDLTTQLALQNLPNLEILNLASNELTDLVEYAVKNFTKLVWLDLSNNELEFVPTTLALMGALEKLVLDSNPMAAIGSDDFHGLNNLIELSISNMPNLVKVETDFITPLVKLRSLIICNNKMLKSLPENDFSMKQQLKELFLKNNSLSSLSSEFINFTSLKIFELQDNPLQCTCDLYEVTKSLSDPIKETAGPHCRDFSHQTKDIYKLSKDVCNDKPHFMKHEVQKRFNMVRWFLVSLSIVLTTLMVVAFFIIFTRYRRHQRFSNYPFVANVSYNPLQTQPNIN